MEKLCEFFERALNLIIAEKPELVIYLLSMAFLVFMVLILYKIVKIVLEYAKEYSRPSKISGS